jgi:hypothetical protein
MKFVMVQFEDSIDISTLTVNSVVQVGTVTNGTIAMNGNMSNPAASTLIPHTHTFDAPSAITGPAVQT